MSKNQNNKNQKNNSNYKKLIMIAVAAIAVIAVAYSIKLPGKTSDTNSATNSNSEVASDVNSEVDSEDTTQLAVTKDSDMVISVKDITDKATFYPAEIDGTNLEVIAVKAPDGTIRTAFNTCQVCYTSGRGYYKQEGDDLVCQNCGNRFGMGDVEVTKGGCNPVPIADENKTVTNDTITISKDFLTQTTAIFANWK